MTALRTMARRLVKGGPKRAIAYQIAVNQWHRLRMAFGRFGTSTGATLATLSEEESLAYIRRVRDEYARFGDLDAHAVAGRRILEVGVGDNFGLALLLLADGARSVTCLDRFHSHRDETRNARIYRRLLDGLDPEPRARAEAAIRSWSPLRLDPDRIHYVFGVGLEEADSRLEAETFEIILSRAVLQQVTDLPRAFDVMDRLLLPGGRLVHQVDLRDQGLFNGTGAHPLAFLTLPDWLNHAMASHSGQSNRHLVDFYRSQLIRRGYAHRIRTTRVTGQGTGLPDAPESLVEGRHFGAAELAMIEGIRPRLLPRYRALSREDLLTAGILFTGTKQA